MSLTTILNEYGHQVTLNQLTIRAFIEPIADNRQAAPYTVTSLGTVDDRLWLCISLEQTAPGDVIVWEDNVFTVRTSEQFVLSKLLSYWRAVLEPAKEAVD